jgi:hypothetical protein
VKWRLVSLVSLALSSSLAMVSQAREVSISALGDLEQRYERARPVDSYAGRELPAQVGFLAGEAFTLVAPRRIQQLEYLLENGAQVEKGAPLVVLRGPEVHHLLAEFEASKRLLEALERRFESNRLLYQRKAIKESQWIDVSKQYYEAELEYEHGRHFQELILQVDDKDDSVTIAAPASGLVSFPATREGVDQGETLALIIPERAVRLEVAIPIAQRSTLLAFRIRDCQLAAERIGRVSQGFFVTAWSEPLPSICPQVLGQQLQVTPVLRGPAFAIARSAVFQWQGRSALLVRQQDTLTVTTVELLQGDGDDYILSADASLAGSEILVSSVSAVQGFLLGLGDE